MSNEIEMNNLLGHTESTVEGFTHEAENDGVIRARQGGKHLTFIKRYRNLVALAILLGVMLFTIDRTDTSHDVTNAISGKDEDQKDKVASHKQPKAIKSNGKRNRTNDKDASNCVDDLSFHLKNFPGKNCAWIAAKKHIGRICDRHHEQQSLVRDMCPVACGVCFNKKDQIAEQQSSIEVSHERSNDQSTIIHGVDEKGVHCEDLSQYEEWHKINITKNDGVMYNVLQQMGHDKESYTQGLSYAKGKLYESAGLYEHSSVRILDADSAQVEKNVAMESNFFAEGLTYYKDTLVQITWKSQRGFIYNRTDLEIIETFNFTTTKNQGWGITWDRCNDELIVTDGSPYLHFWDPSTMTETRKVRAKRKNGKYANNMNEIEFWRGRVLANVWYEDVVLVINPETGVVEKEYDFSQLWPSSQRIQEKAEVLNGISIAKSPDALYFTGKKWDRMYLIQLLPEL